MLTKTEVITTDALIVGAYPLFASRQEQLVALAERDRVPAISEWREFVEAGGLMSYGTVVRDGLHKGGIYAGRILKGASPADLPASSVVCRCNTVTKGQLVTAFKAGNRTVSALASATRASTGCGSCRASRCSAPPPSGCRWRRSPWWGTRRSR